MTSNATGAPGLSGMAVPSDGSEPGVRSAGGGAVSSILASLRLNKQKAVLDLVSGGAAQIVVEAFGFGAPVITSNIDPMREVAGTAALLVDPYDTTAISNAMVRLIGDEGVRSALTAKGHERIGDFSSKTMTEQLERLYISGSETRPQPS